MDPSAQAELGWIKAQRSYASSSCVELARCEDDSIMLRDSKNPEVHLHYTQQEMQVFIEGVKDGEFDHLLTSPDVTTARS